MRTATNVMLAIAGAVFLVFVANVVAGATTGSGFLSDVAEMLTLLGACVAFVIAVLGRERSEKPAAVPSENHDNPGGNTA